LGTYNTLEAELDCPFCGTPLYEFFQFRYGMCEQDKYRIGDKIRWNGYGIIYQKRFPNGTGIFTAGGLCDNNWTYSFEAEVAAGTRTRTLPLPIAEREKLGCPMTILIQVEVVEDVIKRAFFSKNLAENFEGEW